MKSKSLLAILIVKQKKHIMKIHYRHLVQFTINKIQWVSKKIMDYVSVKIQNKKAIKRKTTLRANLLLTLAALKSIELTTPLD